jgi:hypothetical protein
MLFPSVLSIFPAGRSLFSDLLRDSRQAFEAGDSNDTITVFTPGWVVRIFVLEGANDWIHQL